MALNQIRVKGKRRATTECICSPTLIVPPDRTRAECAVAIAGRAISLRPGDITLSAPLGFASYNTTGGIRKIEYRAVAAD